MKNDITFPLDVAGAQIEYDGKIYDNCAALSEHLNMPLDVVVKHANTNGNTTSCKFNSLAVPNYGYTYSITNTVTGVSYIGSCSEIASRLSAHRNDLRRGKHTNPRLQAAYNEYGAEAFTITYREHASRSEAYEYEQQMLDQSDGSDLYNTSKSVDATSVRFDTVNYQPRSGSTLRRKRVPNPGVVVLLHAPTGIVTAYRGSNISEKLSVVLKGAGGGKSEFTRPYGVEGPISNHDLTVLDLIPCPYGNSLTELAKLHRKYCSQYRIGNSWSGLAKPAIYKKWTDNKFEVVLKMSSVDIDLDVGSAYELIATTGNGTALDVLGEYERLWSLDPSNRMCVESAVGFVGLDIEPTIATGNARFEIVPAGEFRARYDELCAANRVGVLYADTIDEILAKLHRHWTSRQVDVTYDLSDPVVGKLIEIDNIQKAPLVEKTSQGCDG